MATSQFIQTTDPAEMARALNAAWPLTRFEEINRRAAAILDGAFLCPECGEIDGAPATFYDAGDASVGYGPDEIECCTLCVRGFAQVSA
jgi:hypothetical protein